jgi:hypothetical protein
MVGEGGFGCVYRGVIKNSDEPTERIEIAVKQLNRKGVQASSFTVLYFLTVLLLGTALKIVRQQEEKPYKYLIACNTIQ